LWRGFYADAQRLASAYQPDAGAPNTNLHALVLRALGLIFQRKFDAAAPVLAQADSLCQLGDLPSCGELLKAHGSLALVQGKQPEAWQFNTQAYAYAQAHRDPLLAMRASLNLGQIALNSGHYDLSQEWSRVAYRDALRLGDEDVAMMAQGNLAQASFPFGDAATAREQFLQVAETAERLGDLRSQLVWLQDAGETDAFIFNYAHALPEEKKALEIAQKTGDRAAIWNSSLILANTLAWSGDPQAAKVYFQLAAANLPPGNNPQQRVQKYASGMIAVQEHRDAEAEAIYRESLQDSTPSDFWRFEAAAQLAGALQRQGRERESEAVLRKWMAVFEAERQTKTDVASHRNYLTWGMSLYTATIQLLLHQGHTEAALAMAEQATARSLAQGLGVRAENASAHTMPLNPRQIAQKSGATILYYWLGREQSDLWVITPAKIDVYLLPREKEIADAVVRYRKTLLNLEDPLSNGNADGRYLYRTLAAPAAATLRPAAPVIVIAGGELGALNMEALIAPGRAPGSGDHYWIEDVTLRSAPSLSALAAARKPVRAANNLLLIGDAVAANQDYPELPMAPLEMSLIEKHFPPSARTVLARSQATPEAYLHSSPERYDYIHFVTHGVASRLDPLESSIILSPPSSGTSDFKLYANAILQHPVDARLVTISTCYGSGARVFAGEGLVGLSWAFLHAGAHNVIGTLWEVSDESSPRLMDGLYEGLQHRKTPDVALRQAKLAMLHSSAANFHAPFYWASFQDYSRQ